jgi:hypothetical protein
MTVAHSIIASQAKQERGGEHGRHRQNAKPWQPPSGALDHDTDHAACRCPLLLHNAHSRGSRSLRSSAGMPILDHLAG